MFDECLGPVRGVVVSSTYKIYYLPLEALGTSDDAGEEQRWWWLLKMKINNAEPLLKLDGRVWLCGPEFRLARNTWTSFEMTLQGIERQPLFKQIYI